jgi:hypothetical protein
MQFLTIGGIIHFNLIIFKVIGTIIGYFVFYSCSNVTILNDLKKFNSCQTDGPAIFLNFWADIIGLNI